MSIKIICAIIFVFLIISSTAIAQKIDPELIKILSSKSSEDIIDVIIITNKPLSSADMQKLSEINASIVKNFTVASWYEIKISAQNVGKLQDLDFIKEIKPIKEYEPLTNESNYKEFVLPQNFLYMVLILAAIIILVVWALNKKIKWFGLFITVSFFLTIPLSLAENKETSAQQSFIINNLNFDAEKISLIKKKFQEISPLSKKIEKIDPQIYSQPNEKIRVIIEIDRDDDYSTIRNLQVSDVQEFGFSRFRSAIISKSEIPKLEKIKSIKNVWIEKEYRPLLDKSVPLINANIFWANGYDGSGIKVCILDTGINKTHPALSSRVVLEKDFTNDNDPRDYNGHGTHIAGIIASTDLKYRGVAPGVSILNAKVLPGTTSTVISGIDWCIANGANIFSMSLGAGYETNDGSDALSAYSDAVVDMGKIVIVAAGNSGPDGNTNCRTSLDSTGSSYSICSPGLAHKVITVGSTQTNKYWWLGHTNDGLSSFSSRGPTRDGRIKPDLMAPGQIITSTNAGYLSDLNWTDIQGTSASAPHVAGLSALILQARPSITPEELKALLMNSANDLGATGKDNSYGAGRINAERAFGEISNTIKDTIGSSYKVHNIFVPSGSVEIRATLYWPENYSLHNDIDLYLLDPAGNVRAYSTSAPNTDEMIKLTSPSPSGNWKLLVDPYDVSGNQVYALASNFKISDQRNIIVNNISQIVYHKINVTTSSKPLIVNFDWNSPTVNLDIYLYNTTGHLTNYSNAVDKNYEEVSINNPNIGIWLVRLVPYNLGGNSQVQYTLTSSFPISEQTLDTTPPIVTLLEPLNISYNKQNISLKFNVIENIDKFVVCSGVIDDNSTSYWTVENDSVFISYFSVAEGAHKIYVNCSDGSNNIGSSSTVYFSIDLTPPIITFIPPSDQHDSIVNRSYILINVSVIDACDIDSCFLEWNGINISMTKIGSGNSVNCFINKSDVDGTYNYRVYANDSLNNFGNSSQRNITFDTIYPLIISYSPSDNSYILGTDSQTFVVNYTESNLDYIQLYWNETWPYNISNQPINLTGCSSGVYKTCSHNLNLSKYSENDRIVFYFGVFDKTGKSSYMMNPQNQPYNTIIHRTPPYYLSITQYPSDNPIYGQNVQLNSTWTDIAGVSKVFLESNHTGTYENYTALNQNSSYSYVISSSYLNGGKVVFWRFIASDNLNNWNVSMPYQNFTIQKSASSIKILINGSEDDEICEKGQLVNITATVNVSGKPIIIETNFTGSKIPTAYGVTTATNMTNTGNLILGAYNITAYFPGDENYTYSTQTRYLTVRDTTPPTIVNSEITPSIVKPNSNITFTATILDNDVVKYAYIVYYNSSWYPIQQQNLTNIENYWLSTFNLTEIPNGIYYFNVTAVDNSGNNKTVWANNITVNQTFGTINTFVNSSVFTLNNRAIVDAIQTTNVTLEIKTNQSVSNATIIMAAYTENPGTVNIGIPALNKYFEITTSHNLNISLSWAIIKVYYNDSDVPQAYSKRNLRIYYQNPDGSWNVYDGPLRGGSNTTANYVWANTTHFSIYGLYIMPTCDDGIQNQGESGIDCGGPCLPCPSPQPSGGAGGGGVLKRVETGFRSNSVNGLEISAGSSQILNINFSNGDINFYNISFDTKGLPKNWIKLNIYNFSVLGVGDVISLNITISVPPDSLTADYVLTVKASLVDENNKFRDYNYSIPVKVKGIQPAQITQKSKENITKENVTMPIPTQKETPNIPSGYTVLILTISNPATMSIIIIVGIFFFIFWKKLFASGKKNKKIFQIIDSKQE
ncbi:MAG: S8 family serine peptidase [Candidatus Aenigmatarchaeota archaeon]